MISQFIESRRQQYDSLDTVVEHALQKTGKEKVHLVGYSLGGIHTRSYAQARPEAVSGCFMWVTPHGGAPLGALGGISRRLGIEEGVVEQIAQGSAYLKKLNEEFYARRGEYIRKNVHFVNLFARYDLLVPCPHSAMPFADRQYECKRSFHINAILSSYLSRMFIQDLAMMPTYPIVMLHGMGATPAMFDPLVAKIKQNLPDFARSIYYVHYDIRKKIPEYRLRYALAS